MSGRPTAAKGGFPYEHMACAEWMVFPSPPPIAEQIDPSTLRALVAIIEAVVLTEKFSASNITSIQLAVCRKFGLKPRDMQTARRDRIIARPRQVAMYLCRELTRKSLPQIGRAFGNRDHTTVMHACRQVEKLRAEDPVFDGCVRDVERAVQALNPQHQTPDIQTKIAFSVDGSQKVCGDLASSGT
jgi:hypothetical protein